MRRDSSKPVRRYGDAGFTLVELVVVIAVLAILAGVGAVAYSGYIEKAREAADLELLGAVNTAFASACAEEGIAGLPEQGKAELVDGVISEIGYGNKDDVELTNLTDTFMKYYKGNEDKNFKCFVSLGYDRNKGGFIGELPDGTITTASGVKIRPPVEKNGKTVVEVEMPNGDKFEYVLEGEDKENFANSSFGENMSMPELLGEVDHVVQSAGKVLQSLSPALIDMLLSPSAQQLLSDNGYTAAPNPADYDGGEDDPGYIAAVNAYNNAKLNAIVMSVAQESKDLTADTVMNAVTTGDYELLGFGSDTTALVPTAALVYGVLTGYANSDRGSDKIVLDDGSETTVAEYYKSISDGLNTANPDITALLNVKSAAAVLTDPNNGNLDMFTDYLENGGGKDDINGYIAAMRAINDNSDSLTSSGALEKGFSDEDLSTILDVLFGGN